MKNIIFILAIVVLGSCSKKEYVHPKSIWDKTFGPYNVIDTYTIANANDLVLSGQKDQIYSALTFIADTNITVHSIASVNLYTTKWVAFRLTVNGVLIACDDGVNGLNGVRRLEVDGISLKKGDKLECMVGYSSYDVTVYKDSYLIVESYKK
jgi:hypothetical protein